jgi:hypothetical protein
MGGPGSGGRPSSSSAAGAIQFAYANPVLYQASRTRGHAVCWMRCPINFHDNDDSPLTAAFPRWVSLMDIIRSGEGDSSSRLTATRCRRICEDRAIDSCSSGTETAPMEHGAFIPQPTDARVVLREGKTVIGDTPDELQTTYGRRTTTKTRRPRIRPPGEFQGSRSSSVR